MKTKKQLIKEYIEAIVTALLIALIIRAYVVQAFKIPSGSMIPTLLVGDHLLVNKFIYGIKLPFSDKKLLVIRKPERGDIIVFKYPEDPSRDFIKRVIAVEGDVIEEKDNVVYINGQPLNEPYVQRTDRSNRDLFERRDNFGPYIVPRNKLFVMGDNRDQSYDSRYWGYVDLKDVRGMALIIYWSWDREKNMVRFNRIGKLIR